MRDTAQYADIFAALGSEPRLEIMRLLFAAYPDTLTVGVLQAQLEIPHSTLSHHLEKLRVEGLVDVKRDRQFLCYSANVSAVEDLLSFLYNGCSISSRATSPSESYESIELVQNIPKKENFMLERFLQSIGVWFEGLLSRIALPPGFERFTQEAIQVVFLAQKETRRLGHQYIGTEQLLVGLLATETSIVAQVLISLGANLEQVQRLVEQRIGHGKGTPDVIPWTPRATQTLRLAIEQAQQMGHNHIDTEHLLLGILQEGQGMAVRVLEDLGINLTHLENQLWLRRID
jgi:ArsR family transcriptional regulator, arsenate/arsenite/antimonite-responsive transcriptional repressor / arsenate reductase (thioredoxin)